MAKKHPAKWEAADGTEFDTKEEAERRDEFLAAKQAFIVAEKNLLNAIAGQSLTADGHRFHFHTDYWYVQDNWGLLPHLEKLNFYYGDFNLCERAGGEVVLGKFEESKGSGWYHREYRIGQLYASRLEAQKALLAAQEKKLAEMAGEVEELQKKVRGDWE